MEDKLLPDIHHLSTRATNSPNSDVFGLREEARGPTGKARSSWGLKPASSCCEATGLITASHCQIDTKHTSTNDSSHWSEGRNGRSCYQRQLEKQERGIDDLAQIGERKWAPFHVIAIAFSGMYCSSSLVVHTLQLSQKQHMTCCQSRFESCVWRSWLQL